MKPAETGSRTISGDALSAEGREHWPDSYDDASESSNSSQAPLPLEHLTWWSLLQVPIYVVQLLAYLPIVLSLARATVKWLAKVKGTEPTMPEDLPPQPSQPSGPKPPPVEPQVPADTLADTLASSAEAVGQ